ELQRVSRHASYESGGKSDGQGRAERTGEVHDGSFIARGKSLADQQPSERESAGTLLPVPCRCAGSVRAAAASSGPRGRDEVHRLPQPTWHYKPGVARKSRVGNLRSVSYGEARAVCVRARRYAGRGMHELPQSAWKYEQGAAGSAGRADAVPAVPRIAQRSQRATQPRKLPDAERLYPMPFVNSRLQLECRLPQLRRQRDTE